MSDHHEIPAPDHLSDRAAGIWRDVVADYLLAPHQVEILRRACEAAGVADEARSVLAEEGIVTVDRFGQTRAHPAVAIERDARLAEARLIRELCLSPLEPEDTRPPRAGTAETGRQA